MSDSDPADKKGGIPLWQTATQENPAQTDDKPAPEAGSRKEVLEQAKRFLLEDEVKDASTDKKISFLESKGLQNDEIQQLLGVSRNSEASTTSEIQTSQPSPFPPQQQSSPSQPPIITYPEFLTTPTHPSPLLTTPRLLTILTAFASATALLHGTHTYLITPMLTSLTSSRLSLASTAASNLSTLITKLEERVSVIPDGGKLKGMGNNGEDAGDDEDPTELFHRDIGVQTSPLPSRPTTPPPLHLDRQLQRLSVLKSHLSELQEHSTAEGEDVNALEGTMGVLREVLDGMAYVVPSYYGFKYSEEASGRREEEDEIARCKAGIRGVKGVLLSARSFPGGVRGR